MKKYQNRICVFASLIIVFVLSVSFVNITHATSVPSMSISAITGGTTAQITVIGADPNASVLLSYQGTSAIESANIGSTNASGYFTGIVDAATYGIAPGSSVYVVVDSQASPSSVWPNYTASSGNLYLSQTSLIISVGQSSTVTASVSATLSLTNNTNPSVASVSISANQITITGFSAGTTNITICGGGLGCSSIYVTVQSSTSNVGVTFSQNSVSVPVGQSQTIAISGFGPYYVSSNTYQGVVSTNINGSVLTIAGVVAGTDNINICSSATNDTSCGSISVTVTPSSFTNVSTAQPNLTFGQSNVTLNVGQTGAVAISGGSIPYYISNNQNPSSVGVNVSGTNVDVSGLSFGGDNITICAVGGPCGTLYVYVQAGAGGGVTPSPSTLTAPAISSFSVASNDEDGNFIGSGNILTITFSVNQSISIPKVTIGSTALTMNGSGNGPYTATYTMTGSETLPLSIAINFSNPAGSAGQADFWVGNNAVAPTTFETAAASTVLSSQTNNGNVSTTGYTFTQYLYDGSTGSQVTALQERLTTDGIYSGPITGTFGPLTKAAVKAYQAKHGLDQLGVVGPATRALLNRGI